MLRTYTPAFAQILLTQPKGPFDHKKFGAWQSQAFRDIYTFVRRFQIRFFTTFVPFLPCLRRTAKN
jgi:hypothetical protein